MLESELSALSAAFPAGFIREYDAHIYYDAENRELAEKLRKRAARDLMGTRVFVGFLRDEKLGPHPMAMFELNFSRSCFDEVMVWLKNHRKGLTVLVHEVTGDDFRDHSEGAIWLGAALSLDVSRLARGVLPGRSRAL